MSHIIIYPEWGGRSKQVPYKKLAKTLQDAGHTVTCMNPHWREPLSSNVVKVPKKSILIGFSYGAVIAYLIAKKYPCKKVVLCSITPLHMYSHEANVQDFLKHMSGKRAKIMADDIEKIKLDITSLRCPVVTLVGENEKEMLPADFMVPHTGHRMTGEYINCIRKLLP